MQMFGLDIANLTPPCKKKPSNIDHSASIKNEVIGSCLSHCYLKLNGVSCVGNYPSVALGISAGLYLDINC